MSGNNGNVSSSDCEFEWDDAKAIANLAKHGVDFRDAMTVIVDPLAITIFDSAHSDDEERWATIGRSSIGELLLVIHTFVELDHLSKNSMALVRLISARLLTRKERDQYEQGNL